MDLNLNNILHAINWLQSVVTGSLNVQFGKAEGFEAEPLIFYEDESSISNFLQRNNPTSEEFAIILFTLAPHLKPDFFSKIIAEFLPNGGDLPEFGGIKSGNHRGIMPTGETAQYVLAGNDLEKRIEIQRLFNSEHWFSQKHILWLEPIQEGEPVMSGRLILDKEIVELLTTGKVSKPRFSLDFPAEYLETAMDWDDLVLNPHTQRQIREIEHWIKHNDTLLYDWGMKNKIKPGYRALFYGPPGTGKTLTASLLGKHTGRDVFRIDLSRVVSKYIGETEKNLSRLLDKAEHKEWILFFDEADALFGKRTEIRDAHDKYANQEAAYLLQRIEAYNGLIILASNQRANIDDAFVRRFQTIIHFPMPKPEERYAIWKKTFPSQIQIDQDIDWRQIAARYELTGAGILNITHFCAVEALAEGTLKLSLKRLEEAIQREYVKEGKVI
jgi:AAA+ superfamily predicted ATPase